MYDDERKLLDKPELVEGGYLALASAIWFYMTPQTPKPSMHDVVVGHWTPNDVQDKAAGVTSGFGSTTNIINGGLECKDKSSESDESFWRANYY